MRDSKLALIFLGILTFFAVGFVLKILEPILLPFVVAVFLSRIFGPLNTALRRRRVPAALSILIVLVAVSVALAIFAAVVYTSAAAFTAGLPRYQARSKELVAAALAWASHRLPWLPAQIQQWHWQDAFGIESVTGFLAATAGGFLVFLNDTFLVLLFLVFLLLGSEGFPAKLHRALASDHAERLAEMMRNIEAGVRRYLLTKTLINLTTASLVTALMAAFGVDFPLLWGLLTFLAHYIPNFGAVISVALPTMFLFLQLSPGKALLIAALSAAIQLTIGNAVEPRVMGSSLDLSPLLVLLALIFWGWLWGPWGMVLSVPITSTIKIICENVGSLHPVAVLMSGSPEQVKARKTARAREKTA
jgi:predicted PurR-regulated permease PerM